MQKKRLPAIALVLVAFLAIFSLSTGTSSLARYVFMRSTGEIQTAEYARSGSASEIQEAVDWVAEHKGAGNVYLPEGTFNFVEVGEPWATVNVPAGINIFGAPTERGSDDQVIEWKTVLVMPYDAAGGGEGYRTWFFRCEGTGDQEKTSRFSDIKLVGYREFEPANSSWYGGIEIYNVIDFRIDHCFFKNVAGGGVYLGAPANGASCGVIDHNKFINDYGYVEWDYLLCTVQYGIMIRRIGTTEWDDDISNVLGKYNRYTVFIEDNYFSRWRHCVASNDGVHYVFRYNTIEKDSVVGSLDAHGTYDYVGTRATEIYMNTVIDPVDNFGADKWDSTTPVLGTKGYTFLWRGGGGVFFNNYIRNYEVGINLVDEGPVEKCWPYGWIWNNTRDNVPIPLQTYSDYRTITEGRDYFLHEPHTFNYEPYPYPHPLALEETS
jgi:hypothetical protein